jgi:hypothetical protein
MPVTPDELFATLDRLGIAHTTVHHQPLFSVNESQSLRGTIPGGHTKNLFLKDKKSALYLVTALEDAPIDLKSLHRLLGATGRFSFGSAEQMMETLGVTPGSVTAFGAINARCFEHRIGDGTFRKIKILCREAFAFQIQLPRVIESLCKQRAVIRVVRIHSGIPRNVRGP